MPLRHAGKLGVFVWAAIGTCAIGSVLAFADALLRWRETSLIVGIGLLAAAPPFIVVLRIPIDRRRDRVSLVAVGSFFMTVMVCIWIGAEVLDALIRSSPR